MQRQRRLISAASLLTSILLLAVPGNGKDRGKISSDLDGKTGLQDVIIQFKGEVSESKHKKVTGKGGSLKKELGIVRGGAYSVPASAIADLSDDPDVEYITPDRPLSSTLDYATPAVGGAT